VLIEGWTIFHVPGYPYVVRKRYGHGRGLVYARGTMLARTLQDARDLLPRGREIKPYKSRGADAVEVWFTPSSTAAIRKRIAYLRGAR